MVLKNNEGDVFKVLTSSSYCNIRIQRLAADLRDAGILSLLHPGPALLFLHTPVRHKTITSPVSRGHGKY